MTKSLINKLEQEKKKPKKDIPLSELGNVYVPGMEVPKIAPGMPEDQRPKAVPLTKKLDPAAALVKSTDPVDQATGIALQTAKKAEVEGNEDSLKSQISEMKKLISSEIDPTIKKQFDEARTKILSTYEQTRDNLNQKERNTLLGAGIAQLLTGLYGMKKGLDVSGLKFSLPDWQRQIDRALDEYKFGSGNIDKQEDLATKQFEIAKERQLSLGSKGLDLTQRTLENADNIAFRDKQFDAVRADRASDEAFRKQQLAAQEKADALKTKTAADNNATRLAIAEQRREERRLKGEQPSKDDIKFIKGTKAQFRAAEKFDRQLQSALKDLKDPNLNATGVVPAILKATGITAAKGDPEATVQLALENIRIDKFLEKVAGMKGAISNYESKMLQQAAPKIGSDESVWINWINQIRDELAEAKALGARELGGDVKKTKDGKTVYVIQNPETKEWNEI